MSKRKKATQKTVKAATSQPKKSRKWREIRQFTIVFALLATVVGSGLAAFKYSYDASHDLAVIGKGIPAIVQIHDPVPAVQSVTA
jgi:hypothetical protein